MPIKPSQILGMNARYYYTKLNPFHAKAYGFSKLKTKKLLVENHIPTAELYHVFENFSDIKNIIWENVPCPFVIKPASGSAGKGVLVIVKKFQNKPIWLDNEKRPVEIEDLNFHVQNILDGEYSTWGNKHIALVEEMIVAHPILRKLAYSGTPDLRVIVFNSVPIMAMARIPTHESDGKANLDRGAIGLGIDIASGITTSAVQGKKTFITHFPKSKRKTSGILIPHWKEALLMAVKAANAAGYVFMGADLFIHETKGPMIVELNGFPGLSIQLANKAGLKKRIERVEGIDVRDAEHGVKIAQALFAENFVDRKRAEKGLTIISNLPTIEVYGENHTKKIITAMVNTSRIGSSIARNLAEELGLLDYDDLLWQQKEVVEGKVPVVEVAFKIKDELIKTPMVVLNRLNRKKYQVELGKRDVKQFLIGEIEE